MYRDYQYSSGFNIKSLLTPAVTSIILLNFIIFVLSSIFKDSFKNLILVPQKVIENYHFYQLITYMFMHLDTGHLFGNLLILFLIGSYVEKSMGTLKFTIFYLFVGTASGLLYTIIVFLVKIIFDNTLLYEGGMLGASGAVLGVAIVVCLMNWNNYLYLFGIMPIKGQWLILFIILPAIIGTISSFKGKETVSHLGHLSGIIIAYLYYKKPFGKGRKPFQKKRKVKSVFEEDHFYLHND